MGDYLTFNTVNLIVSLVTIIFIAVMYFKKPQLKMDDQLRDLKSELTANSRVNNLKIEQLKDSFVDLKKNDLHELNCRQDQFSKLIIEQTREMANINGQQKVIVKLLTTKEKDK